MPAGADIWSSGDADWATRLATQELGDAAPVERFIDTRARSPGSVSPIIARILKRGLEKRDLGTFFGWVIILLALIVGILTDQIGDSRQVNLLTLPFVAIIVWNLAIYVWLLLLRPVLGLFGFKGWVRRWLESSSRVIRMPALISSSLTRFHCADVVRRTGPGTTCRCDCAGRAGAPFCGGHVRVRVDCRDLFARVLH